MRDKNEKLVKQNPTDDFQNAQLSLEVTLEKERLFTAQKRALNNDNIWGIFELEEKSVRVKWGHAVLQFHDKGEPEQRKFRLYDRIVWYMLVSKR